VTADPAAALARLVGDVPSFVDQVWAQRAARWPGICPEGFSDLLDLDGVDALIAGAGLRAPAVRLVRDGKPRPASVYTRTARIGGRTISDAIDPEAVFAEVGAGTTVVLQALHRYVPSITDACRRLEAFFGHPLQANAYLTPKGWRGLPVHHDTHDVFVLQLHGHKRWTLFAPAVDDPVPGHPRSPRYDEPLPEQETLRLDRGDCLYLPRGIPHRAETAEAVSLHLTLGVRSPTWLDVLERAMVRAKHEPAFRASLPIGYSRDAGRFESKVEQMLQDVRSWIGTLDPVEIAASEIERVHASHAPDRIGRLRAVIESSEVKDDAELVRATDIAWRLGVDDPAHIMLRAGNVTLRFPRRIEPALRVLLAHENLTPAVLSEHLDVAGRGTLMRRLLREGLVRRRTLDGG
jgi:hypothetical protein